MTAEAIILDLIGVLLGDKRPGRGSPNDMGLLSHVVNGTRHLERCQYGMWITPGLRGDPCGERCQRVHAAISAAERWLERYAASLEPTPRQMALVEVASA